MMAGEEEIAADIVEGLHRLIRKARTGNRVCTLKSSSVEQAINDKAVGSYMGVRDEVVRW